MRITYDLSSFACHRVSKTPDRIKESSLGQQEWETSHCHTTLHVFKILQRTREASLSKVVLSAHDHAYEIRVERQGWRGTSLSVSITTISGIISINSAPQESTTRLISFAQENDLFFVFFLFCFSFRFIFFFQGH